MLSLHQLFIPIFQVLRDRAQELVGNSAVYDSVIVAERDVADGSDGDGVSSDGVGHNHRHLLDGTNAHDRDLRLQDDGQSEHLAELAGVGDGERATLYIVGQELLGTGAIAKIADGALQSEEAFLFSVLDDRNDQSPIESDGN